MTNNSPNALNPLCEKSHEKSGAGRAVCPSSTPEVRTLPKPNREPLPVVALTLPRCQRCQRATHLKVTATRENTDARRVQYITCRACGARFVFIWD